MRSALLLLILGTVVLVGAEGEPWTSTLTVPPREAGTSGERHLWLPKGVTRIRAVFLFTSHGSFRGFSASKEIQALSRELQCGIVLSEDPHPDPEPMLEVLETFAARSGHPEIANAPLFLFGHSNSSRDIGRFATRVPERVAGWVAMKSAYGEQFSVPELYSIPGMVVSGNEDHSYFSDQLATVRKLRREHGALMHMLIEADGPHWPVESTFEIMMAFLKNVFYLRVPYDGDATLAPVQLTHLAEKDGWLGQNVAGKRVKNGTDWKWEQPTDVKRLLEIAPFAEYPADAKDASWFPNADYARKWQEYCHTVKVTDWGSLPPGTVESWKSKRRPPTIDGVESTLFAVQVKRLASGQGGKAVIKELQTVADDSTKSAEATEATRILGLLTKQGDERLTQAKRLEKTHPPSALVAYQALAKRFDGLAVSEIARERMKAKDFKQEVLAWNALERLILIDDSLITVDGAKRHVEDQTFVSANAKRLQELHGVGNGILRQYGETQAASEAKELLARLGIPVAARKP